MKIETPNGNGANLSKRMRKASEFTLLRMMNKKDVAPAELMRRFQIGVKQAERVLEEAAIAHVLD